MMRAPLSTAQRIARASSKSENVALPRFACTIIRRASPPKPSTPVASSAAPAASEATNVPWPTASVTAG